MGFANGSHCQEIKGWKMRVMDLPSPWVCGFVAGLWLTLPLAFQVLMAQPNPPSIPGSPASSMGSRTHGEGPGSPSVTSSTTSQNLHLHIQLPLRALLDGLVWYVLPLSTAEYMWPGALSKITFTLKGSKFALGKALCTVLKTTGNTARIRAGLSRGILLRPIQEYGRSGSYQPCGHSSAVDCVCM